MTNFPELELLRKQADVEGRESACPCSRFSETDIRHDSFILREIPQSTFDALPTSAPNEFGIRWRECSCGLKYFRQLLINGKTRYLAVCSWLQRREKIVCTLPCSGPDRRSWEELSSKRSRYEPFFDDLEEALNG
jgi:hypothetical protein